MPSLYRYISRQWWIWYDEHIRVQEQVNYCSNVNINWDSKEVTLNGKPTNRVATWWKKIYWFIEWENSSWDTRVFWYWEDWVIYRADWATSHTFSDWLDVRNACHFNWYIYFLRAETGSEVKIWKILLQDLYDSDWSEFEESIAFTEALPNGTAKSLYPMYDHWDALLFWIWENLISVNNADAEDKYAIFYDWILSIVSNWSWFIITCSNWHIRTWTFWSSATSWGHKYTSKIRWVISKWHISYSVVWNSSKSSKLAMMSWWQSVPITDAITSSFWKDKFRIFYEKIWQSTEIWDEVYFLNEYEDWKISIWSYGKKHYSKPEAFQEFCSLDSQWNEYSSIESIYSSESWWDDIIYIWLDWYIEQLNVTTPTYQPTWEIYEKTFTWEVASQRYQIEEITLLWDNCDANNTIEVQLSIDWWDFQTVQTLTDSGIQLDEDFQWWLDFFYLIPRIILTSHDWSKTPIYKELSVIYREINNNN